MKIDIFQVDSFTDDIFEGHNSAVCPLSTPIDDSLMQKIAAEINLNKTAFIIKKEHSLYEVRWFTPKTEVTVSDHAALASAYVIFNYLNPELSHVTLKSLSDVINVTKEGEFYSLSFKSKMPILHKENNPLFSLATGIEPLKVLTNLDYILVYENEDIIKNIRPKNEVFKSLDLRGVCVTARGNNSDFVFRYFAPKLGEFDDLITGSLCAQLVPYWSKVLDRDNSLKAHQLSSRTSEIICDLVDDSVFVKGKAKLFMKGEIVIEQRSAHRTTKSDRGQKLAVAV